MNQISFDLTLLVSFLAFGMTFLALFLLLLAIILQFIRYKLSGGLDITLSLNTGCGNDNTNSKPQENDYSDAKLILQMGFNNFNSTVVAAENIAMHGFSQASELIALHPRSALNVILDSIDDSQDKFFESGIPVYLCVGKAVGLCPGCNRKPFVEAIQKLLFLGLKVLDTMRLGKSLASQGIPVGDDASKQLIKAIRAQFKAELKAFYQQIPVSYQQSIQAISDFGSSQPDEGGKTQNFGALPVTLDPNATVAISNLYNDAKMSIANGANESKVLQLFDALRSLIGDIAEVENFLYNSFLKYQTLSYTDPISAKNLLIEDSEMVHKRIQEIFTNICLELAGVAGNLSEEQIGKAFVFAEHGNDKVTYANNIALQTTLDSFKYEANVREIMFRAVLEILNFGKISLYESVVKGAKVVFDIL